MTDDFMLPADAVAFVSPTHMPSLGMGVPSRPFPEHARRRFANLEHSSSSDVDGTAN